MAILPLNVEYQKNKWKDISSETRRCYEFPNGESVCLDYPQYLHVSESGGHRVITADTLVHYIPPKWIHLWWTVENGKPFVVC